MSGSYDTPLWRALSTSVRATASCRYCGSTRDLVAHHKIPRRDGGPDSLDNLEPGCRGCHPKAELVAQLTRRQSAPLFRVLRPRRPTGLAALLQSREPLQPRTQPRGLRAALRSVDRRT